MSRIFIVLVLLSYYTLLFAQGETQIVKKDTSYWQHGGFAQLTFNQASFTNWAAGGQNSLALTVTGNYFDKYLKGKHSWDNSIDGAYGFLKYKGQSLRKSDDQLAIQSKYGYDLAKNKIYWSTLLNFKTQFSDGYNYPDDSTVISTLLSPGYLVLSTGIDYKPSDWFSLYFSPATGKVTFVTNQNLANQGAFGVDAAVVDESGAIITEGKNVRAEFGAYLNLGINKDIIKNVNIDSKADLFMNYTDKDKTLRGNVDVNWVTTITMKINAYLTTSLIMHLIYDHDVDIALLDDDGNQLNSQRPDGTYFADVDGNPIPLSGPRTQFKQVFGLSLSYKFQPKK